jgi:microcystin-dependent protein
MIKKISTIRQSFVPYPAMPIGTVIYVAYITPPDGWLECNGQAIDRTMYSLLFDKISTTYGAGNGTTTFNLPDLRGEFIRGWDNSKGIDNGRVFGSYQEDELKSHNHIIYNTQPDSKTPVTTTNDRALSGTGWQTNFNPYTSSTGGTETRPRNIALMPIIKAMNIAGYDPAVNVVGNADTVDGHHSSDFLLKSELITSGLAFCMINPLTNQESSRYVVKKDMKAIDVVAISTIVPTANVTINVYQNSTIIANFTTKALSTTYSINPNIMLHDGDILYAKINGAPNGIVNITIQLTIVTV